MTTEPTRMWGTDATSTGPLAEGQFTVFAAIDHCTAERVGIHAAKRAPLFEALEPLRQGIREHFGAFVPQAAAGLRIRQRHTELDRDSSAGIADDRIRPYRLQNPVPDLGPDCLGPRWQLQ